MTWPYDDPLEPLEAPSPFPRWDCPGGICECHPTDGEAKTTKVAILLRDDLGARMPGAHCRVWYGGRLIASDLVADGDGWVTPEIPERASVLYLEWAPASLPREPGYPISKSYVVDLPRRQRREAVRTRLANLGYENGPLLDDDVRAFEVDHGHAPSGDWQQIEHELESYHDQGSEPAASKPTTQLAFFGDEDAPAPPGGGGSPIPTQSGSAQFSSDFPTPLQAKAQGKIFHEFQTATTQIKDGQGREWSVMLLVSHDALKWEVPTETVRGAGVSASEGKYWERTFRDLKTPDPLVTGLNPLRAIRLPTSARDFQAFADDFRFSVANLLKLKRLKHVESFADLGTPPSNDRALSCLLPTTMVLDLRFSMTGHGAPQTHTGGGDPRLSVLIPQVHDVNGRMNALYTAHSAMVGNPGKLWIIHNKLYADPHGARTRRHHKGTKQPLAVNYGWHTHDAASAGPAGGPAISGPFFVMQPAESGHDILYKDYSQVVVLVAGWCGVFDPTKQRWSWESTRDLYLNQGNIQALGQAHNFSLADVVSPDLLVTADTN